MQRDHATRRCEHNRTLRVSCPGGVRLQAYAEMEVHHVLSTPDGGVQLITNQDLLDHVDSIWEADRHTQNSINLEGLGSNLDGNVWVTHQDHTIWIEKRSRNGEVGLLVHNPMAIRKLACPRADRYEDRRLLYGGRLRVSGTAV